MFTWTKKTLSRVLKNAPKVEANACLLGYCVLLIAPVCFRILFHGRFWTFSERI